MGVQFAFPFVFPDGSGFGRVVLRDISGCLGLRGMGGISWEGVGAVGYFPFSDAVHISSVGGVGVSVSWESWNNGSEVVIGRCFKRLGLGLLVSWGGLERRFAIFKFGV